MRGRSDTKVVRKRKRRQRKTKKEVTKPMSKALGGGVYIHNKHPLL